MADTKDMQVVSPDGKLGTVPAEQFRDAVTKYGYRVPTAAELAEHEKQQTYGEGTANEVKAFGAGVLRGGTFGASDYALPALGVTSKEALAEREKRNPASSVAGELTGAVGSAVVAPEVSPVGLLGKAGSGIARAVAPEAAAAGASLASRVLNSAGQVGAKALGSAVEGAAFGAGQTVSEAALGDPDLTAEKVAANIGYGALMGGALGAVVKAGQMAIPASVGAAKDALAKGYNSLTGRAAGELDPVLKTATAVGEGEPAVLAATGTDAAAEVAPPTTRASPLSKAVSAISGKPEAEVVDTLARARAGEIMTPEQLSKHAATMRDGLQEIVETTTKASRDAQALARPQETEAFLKDVDPGKAEAEYQRVHGQIRQTIAEMQARPELYPARFPAKLELIQEGLEAGVAPEGATAADFFRTINEAKQALDTKIPWGKEISGEAADAINLTKSLRSAMKTSLEDEGVWGEAGVRQAAFNNTTSDLLTAEKELQRRLMYKVKTKSGGITYKVDPSKLKNFLNQVNDVRGERTMEALQSYLDAAKAHVDQVGKSYETAPFEKFDKDAVKGLIERQESQLMTAKNAVSAQPGGFGFFTDLLHPAGAVSTLGRAVSGLRDADAIAAKLANLERQAQKTTNFISKTSKALFRPVAEAAAKVQAPAGKALTQDERLAQFERRADEVQQHAAAPEALIDRLHEATKDTYDVAPKVTSSLQAAAIRAATFLAAKVPQPPTPQLPLDRKWKPSQAEVTKFDRYYAAVHDPLSVMQQLKDGRLTPESLEAVKTVYPQLYGEMQKEVLSELTSHLAKAKTGLTFQRKMALSTFLGQPLDSSMLPENIAVNQASHAAPSRKAENGAVKPSQKGLQSLDVSGRAMTPMQQTGQRSTK